MMRFAVQALLALFLLDLACPSADAQDAPDLAAFQRAIAKREDALAGAVVEAVEVHSFETPEMSMLRCLRVSFRRPCEKWRRWDLSVPRSYVLDLIDSGVAFPEPEFASTVAGSAPNVVAVGDGGRMLYMYPSFAGPAPAKWSGQVKSSFDAFERRGALNEALLYGERWWSESAREFTTLGVEVRASGQLTWLFRSPPGLKGQVALHRFVTGPAPEFTIRRHVLTVVPDRGIPAAIAAWQSDPEAISPAEKAKISSEVYATVEFRGVTLPSCHQWKASYVPPSSARTWLRYSEGPVDPDHRLDSSFDVGMVPEECRGALEYNVVDELTRVTLTAGADQRLVPRRGSEGALPAPEPDSSGDLAERAESARVLPAAVAGVGLILAAAVAWRVYRRAR